MIFHEDFGDHARCFATNETIISYRNPLAFQLSCDENILVFDPVFDGFHFVISLKGAGDILSVLLLKRERIIRQIGALGIAESKGETGVRDAHNIVYFWGTG